ncbi:MAG: Holliday junction branch migration DNA helicase RuvB [Helicobacteraceae bacterium]|jgi:Holliday junction DNA helicase RuvB|nr:Holliday junction branch migration DNA helicase RuvB [Helicobacteraceae bacterium]
MERIIEVEKIAFDGVEDASLRPSAWEDYIGQSAIKNKLRVFIDAARKRAEPIDHLLFFGPPGLGKTTLAYLIAREMGANIKTTAGPMIEKSGDLAAILTNLNEGDILFIDEIHRMSHTIEEVLYPAMEDFRLDIIIGSGPAAQTVKIDLQRFTLIGATTRAGMIGNPLRDRFGAHFRMQFYDVADLAAIAKRAANKLGKPIEDDAAEEIARRSRGTPRIALRLLRRVRDYAEVEGETTIGFERAKSALDSLGVNEHGFDELDLRLLALLVEARGRAIGLSALGAKLSEDGATIEEVIEPYLLANGYLERTARGRIATIKSYEALKLSAPAAPNQGALFNDRP